LGQSETAPILGPNRERCNDMIDTSGSFYTFCDTSCCIYTDRLIAAMKIIALIRQSCLQMSGKGCWSDKCSLGSPLQLAEPTMHVDNLYHPPTARPERVNHDNDRMVLTTSSATAPTTRNIASWTPSSRQLPIPPRQSRPNLL
jgi:hypothetical protein